MEKIISYKGFDKNLKCRCSQFEVGKEYTQEGEIIPCKNGFHACENPFDVLDYYNDIDGKYCIVEQSGNIVQDGNKIASSKIKIKTEIGFTGLFKAGIEWIKEKTINNTKENILNDNSGYSAKIGSSGDSAQIGSSGYSAKIGSSGYSAKIGSSGDYAQIGSSGYYAKIGSSGDYAQITSSGKNSVICCAGNNSMAKAKIGSWITLSEWKIVDDKHKPICVKTEYVDGERIKEDTWYKLINGEFVEQDGNNG